MPILRMLELDVEVSTYIILVNAYIGSVRKIVLREVRD